MTHFAYYYRRRHLDGTTSISLSSGPVVIRCNTAELGVFDYRLGWPSVDAPQPGRRGTSQRTIDRPAAVAARLWLWYTRPMRIIQQIDKSAGTTHFRIDFATTPLCMPQATYQTDLYLDLFVTANGDDYVIDDEDELVRAASQGLISPESQAAVLSQCDALVQLLEAGQFRDWLASCYSVPFTFDDLRGERDNQKQGFGPGEPDGWPLGAN